MKIEPIQERFNAGEISPRLQGQVSSEPYQFGLGLCDNFIPQVQGSLLMRPGTTYIKQFDSGQTTIKLAEFRRSIDQDFVVEIGDDMIRVNNRDGIITDTFTEELVLDGSFVQGLAGWSFSWINNSKNLTFDLNDEFFNPFPNPVIQNNKLRLTDFNTSALFQPFPPFADYDFPYLDNALADPPYFGKAFNRTGTVVNTGDPTAQHRIRFSTDQLLGAYAKAYGDGQGSAGFIDGVYSFYRLTYGFPPSDELQLPGKFRLRIGTSPNSNNIFEQVINYTATSITQRFDYDFTFTPGAGNDTFYITFQGVSDTFPDSYYDDPWKITDADTEIWLYNVSIRQSVAGGNAVEFASPWGQGQVTRVHYEMDIANGDMYFFHPNVRPQKLSYDGLVWSFAPYAPAGAPAVWAGTNWPGTGVIHQGRLWTGGTPQQRSTIWASKPADYSDMTPGPLDDDGLLFPLTSAGEIQWLRSHKDLVIGTDINENLGS